MGEIIKTEVQSTQQELLNITGKKISEEYAFSHTLLKYYFDVDFSDQIGSVTDGPNDGGIDFLYYDEEESKVILCQSKYCESLSFNDIINELNKMYSTVQNFKKANTGMYNDVLKLALQNAKDRLPEDNDDNYEYRIYTTAPIDINGALKKLKTQHMISQLNLLVYTQRRTSKKQFNDVLRH